jgi:carboxypeptidase PM20D1
VRLVATAAGGHSNSPPNRTSIGALSNALARLEASQMDADLQGPTELMLERLAPHASFPMRVVLANLWLFEPLVEWGLTLDPASAATVRTTTAITMFHAGVKDNVLSSKAEAIVNFRIRPGQTVQDVLDHIRDSIDDDEIEIECTSECRDPTPTSDPQSEGFAIIETSIRQVYGDVVVTPYLVVGGTDARYYQAISNHVYRFLPVRLQPEDLQRMHGTDERVAVADAGDAARFYATFIVNASD